MTRQTITLEKLDLLEVDENNRLYWDGEPIVTMAKFSFPWWINMAALLVGAQAAISIGQWVYSFFA